MGPGEHQLIADFIEPLANGDFVEIWFVSGKNQTTTSTARHSSEAGFALISAITLAPVLALLFIAIGGTLSALKAKSLAQSICIQEASRLQKNLQRPLTQLLRLNRKATSLRQQRLAADRGVQAAVATGNPKVIAAAKAIQTAVIVMQMALRTQQQALLLEANSRRRLGHNNFRVRARRLGATEISSPTFYPEALAVQPSPPGSLSPNYEKVFDFSRRQQQLYRFRLDLLKDMPFRLTQRSVQQMTECSVTLKGENPRWDIQILKANASSNWPLS